MQARFTFLRLDGFFCPPAPTPAPGELSTSSPPGVPCSRLVVGPLDAGETEAAAPAATLFGEGALVEEEEDE